MAGAGARSKKDGSPSAKVGSIEVLKPRMLGPTIPTMRELSGMYAEAAGARGQARRTLEARAESARRARSALLTARGDEKRAKLAKAAEGTAPRAGETATQHYERLVMQRGHLYADRMHTADAARRAEMTAQIKAHDRVMPGAERAMRAEAAKAPPAPAKGPEWSKRTITPEQRAARERYENTGHGTNAARSNAASALKSADHALAEAGRHADQAHYHNALAAEHEQRAAAARAILGNPGSQRANKSGTKDAARKAALAEAPRGPTEHEALAASSRAAAKAERESAAARLADAERHVGYAAKEHEHAKALDEFHHAEEWNRSLPIQRRGMVEPQGPRADAAAREAALAKVGALRARLAEPTRPAPRAIVAKEGSTAASLLAQIKAMPTAASKAEHERGESPRRLARERAKAIREADATIARGAPVLADARAALAEHAAAGAAVRALPHDAPLAEKKAAVARWNAAKAGLAEHGARVDAALGATASHVTIPERAGFNDKLAPKIPSRAYAVATHRGEDGTVVQVHQNRTKTAFWVTATRGDFKAGETMHTTSKAKGEAWRAAVEKGEVSWPGKGTPAPKPAAPRARPVPATKIEKRRNEYTRRDVYDVTHVPSGKSIPFLNSFGERTKAERAAKGTASGKTIGRLISGTPDQQRRAYEAMRRYSTTVHGMYDSERHAYHDARRDRFLKAVEAERAAKAKARREKREAARARKGGSSVLNNAA